MGWTYTALTEKSEAKLIEITTDDGSLVFVNGTSSSSKTLSVVAEGFTPVSYKWEKKNGDNWTTISGATNSSYTITGVENVGTYRATAYEDANTGYYDIITIASVSDGQGGSSPYLFSLSNENFTINTTNDLKPTTSLSYEVKVTGYHGSSVMTAIASGTPTAEQFKIITPIGSIFSLKSGTTDTLVYAANTSTALSSENLAETITIAYDTNKSETKTITVSCAKNGISPTVTQGTGSVTITDASGNTGTVNDGATGKNALQPNRNWTSTYTTINQTATCNTTDFNRTPVVGDTFTNLDGSSNTGTWQVTAISGTTVTIKLLSFVNSKGATGATGGNGTDTWTPVLTSVTRSGNKFTKNLNSSDWNAQFYSKEGFKRCFISWKPSQTNGYIMVGLNADPSATSWDSLDYAIYLQNNGTFDIRESGTTVTVSSNSYTTSNVFRVEYDGAYVNYYKDSTVIRSVARTEGTLLYADSTFYTYNAAIQDVSFGGLGAKGSNYWVSEGWVDLSNTSTYNSNTWYPVVGTTIARNGTQNFKCTVQLNSGTKPAWASHNNGFSVELEVQDQRSGWGTTPATCIKLIDNFTWTQAVTGVTNQSPASYTQMTNASLPVFYLRGGGKYYLATTYACSWSIKTSTYTVSSQSVSPSANTRPTPRGTYIVGSNGARGAYYRGTATSDPATSGSVNGDFYFNTSTGYIRTYNGSSWANDTMAVTNFHVLDAINDIISWCASNTSHSMYNTNKGLADSYVDKLLVGTAFINKLFTSNINIPNQTTEGFIGTTSFGRVNQEIAPNGTRAICNKGFRFTSNKDTDGAYSKIEAYTVSGAEVVGFEVKANYVKTRNLTVSKKNSDDSLTTTQICGINIQGVTSHTDATLMKIPCDTDSYGGVQAYSASNSSNYTRYGYDRIEGLSYINSDQSDIYLGTVNSRKKILTEKDIWVE